MVKIYWKGYRLAVKEQFKNIKLSQTINMTDVWKINNMPDKRIVKTRCPHCFESSRPLLVPGTAEIERSRTKYINRNQKRTDKIIYGVSCNKCGKLFKFELICDSFFYAKLGEH